MRGPGQSINDSRHRILGWTYGGQHSDPTSIRHVIPPSKAPRRRVYAALLSTSRSFISRDRGRTLRCRARLSPTAPLPGRAHIPVHPTITGPRSPHILQEAMHARLFSLGFPLHMSDRPRHETLCRRPRRVWPVVPVASPWNGRDGARPRRRSGSAGDRWRLARSGWLKDRAQRGETATMKTSWKPDGYSSAA